MSVRVNNTSDIEYRCISPETLAIQHAVHYKLVRGLEDPRRFIAYLCLRAPAYRLVLLPMRNLALLSAVENPVTL